MTKRQIKATIKNLRYFDSTLSMDEKAVQSITASNLKQQRRFMKELECVMKLFNMHIYVSLPESYVPTENFKQIITKQEVKKIITSEAHTAGGLIQAGGFAFTALSETEFDMYLEIYKELSK